jgi:hypothetical protein
MRWSKFTDKRLPDFTGAYSVRLWNAKPLAVSRETRPAFGEARRNSFSRDVGSWSALGQSSVRKSKCDACAHVARAGDARLPDSHRHCARRAAPFNVGGTGTGRATRYLFHVKRSVRTKTVAMVVGCPRRAAGSSAATLAVRANAGQPSRRRWQRARLVPRSAAESYAGAELESGLEAPSSGRSGPEHSPPDLAKVMSATGAGVD